MEDREPNIFARSHSRSKLSQIKKNQSQIYKILVLSNPILHNRKYLYALRNSEKGCSEEGTEGRNKSKAPFLQDGIANQRGDGGEGRLTDNGNISSSREQEIAVTLTKTGRW